MMRSPRFRIPHWMVMAVVVFVGGVVLAANQPAANPPPAQAPAPSQEPARAQNFLQLLVRGGWFMAPIGLASLLGLALVLERGLALRYSRIIPRGFMRGLKANGTDPRKALAYCRAHPCPLGRVMAAGLRKLPRGHAAVEKAIEDAGAGEVYRLRRNLRMLYGVSAVSPMMGLLGTVWGMIQAFAVTAQSKGLGRPELLAKGIYEALVTTLAGLIVAIPVLMFYYYFSGKVEHVVTELNDASTEFTEHFLPDGHETVAEASEVSDADPR